VCRFIAYSGNPILLDDVLFKPKNSLIRQSIHAREGEEPLNGDGFGVGWYTTDSDPIPAIFTSIQPAWNDQNLMNLAPKIRAGVFFAHVRAASTGGVSQFNCHPFRFDRFMFMHNGGFDNFNLIKRHLRALLSDDAYNSIQGQTDSEHFFALFMDIFNKHNAKFTCDEALAVFKETMAIIKQLQSRYAAGESVSYVNIALTDGKNMLATRYVSDDTAIATSLYFSQGHHEYLQETGLCHMLPNTSKNSILIASEKLDSHKADWEPIPTNHILWINEDLTFSILGI
jgi:predicted glutamine amidotransferase